MYARYCVQEIEEATDGLGAVSTWDMLAGRREVLTGL